MGLEVSRSPATDKHHKPLSMSFDESERLQPSLQYSNSIVPEYCAPPVVRGSAIMELWSSTQASTRSTLTVECSVELENCFIYLPCLYYYAHSALLACSWITAAGYLLRHPRQRQLAFSADAQPLLETRDASAHPDPWGDK